MKTALTEMGIHERKKDAQNHLFYERVSETEPREEKLLMLLLLAAVAC